MHQMHALGYGHGSLDPECQGEFHPRLVVNQKAGRAPGGEIESIQPAGRDRSGARPTRTQGVLGRIRRGGKGLPRVPPQGARRAEPLRGHFVRRDEGEAVKPADPAATARPRRGEVWWVDFSPSIGNEVRDEHPALVISTDYLNESSFGGPPNWQSMPSSMRWPVCPFAPSGLPIPGPTTSSPTPSESGKDRYFLHSQPYPY